MLKKKKTKMDIPFQVEAPLPSHKGYEQLHVLVDLDLNPIIIFFKNTISHRSFG